MQADGTPPVRAGYGIWLYRQDLGEEAVTELRRAQADGFESPRLHSYLGFALEDLGRLEEAAAELRLALAGDPSLSTSRRTLEQIEAVLAEFAAEAEADADDEADREAGAEP